MNKVTYQRIIDSTDDILWLHNCPSQLKARILRIASSEIATAVKALDLISDSPCTYRDMSYTLEISVNTCRYFVAALIEGGVSIKKAPLEEGKPTIELYL